MTDIGKRARKRQVTESDILRTADRWVAERGPTGLTLRGVAADVGLAPSALYRYFPGLEALLTALIRRSFEEIGAAAGSAAERTRGWAPDERALAIARAVRAWALEYPHRYALIYGSPVPGYTAPGSLREVAGEVGLALAEPLREALGGGTGPPGSAGTIREGAACLEVGLDADLPGHLGVPEAAAPAAIRLWTYLFGLISFEVFGHVEGTVADPERWFDTEMRRIILETVQPFTGT